MDYKLTANGVIRLDDGAHIPNSLGNRDWRVYLEWLADGNAPQPTDPVPPFRPKPLTAEELADQMIADGTMTRGKIDAIKTGRPR